MTRLPSSGWSSIALALAVVVAVAAFPPAARADDTIRVARLVEWSQRSAVFEVEYTLSAGHGDVIYAGAWLLAGDRKFGGYVPVRLPATGSSSIRMSVTTAASDPCRSEMLEVFLYPGGKDKAGEPFVTCRFPFDADWCSGSAPGPTDEPSGVDLAVTSLILRPSEPTLETGFAVTVYYRNLGDKPAGPFDLTVWARDLTNDSRYPMGGTRIESLPPGDQAGWQSNTIRPQMPARFRVSVELTPVGYSDANKDNNVAQRVVDVLK